MNKKTIAGVGGALIIAYGAITLTAQVAPVTLSLIPDRTTYQVGQNLTVKVDLQATSTVGTDVVVEFDPEYLELNTPPLLPTTNYILGGEIDNPFRFSIIGNKTGTLATMYFKALKTGTTTIHLLNTASSTDSNVALNGEDILEVTNDANITITNKTGK